MYTVDGNVIVPHYSLGNGRKEIQLRLEENSFLEKEKCLRRLWKC